MVQPTIPKTLQPPSPKTHIKPLTAKQQKERIPKEQLEREYKKFYGEIPQLSFKDYQKKYKSLPKELQEFFKNPKEILDENKFQQQEISEQLQKEYAEGYQIGLGLKNKNAPSRDASPTVKKGFQDARKKRKFAIEDYKFKKDEFLKGQKMEDIQILDDDGLLYTPRPTSDKKIKEFISEEGLISGTLGFLAEKSKLIVGDQPVAYEDLPAYQQRGTYYKPSPEQLSILQAEKTALTKEGTGQVSRALPYFAGAGIGTGLFFAESVEAVATPSGRQRIETQREEYITSGISPFTATVASYGEPALGLSIGGLGLKSAYRGIKSARDIKKAETQFMAFEKSLDDATELKIFTETGIGGKKYSGIAEVTIPKSETDKALSIGTSYLFKPKGTYLKFPEGRAKETIIFTPSRNIGIAKEYGVAHAKKDVGTIGKDFLTGQIFSQERKIGKGVQSLTLSDGKQRSSLIGGFFEGEGSQIVGFMGGKPTRATGGFIFQEGRLVPKKVIAEKPSVFGFIVKMPDKIDKGSSMALKKGSQKGTIRPMTQLSPQYKEDIIKQVSILESKAISTIAKVPSKKQDNIISGVFQTIEQTTIKPKTTSTTSTITSLMPIQKDRLGFGQPQAFGQGFKQPQAFGQGFGQALGQPQAFRQSQTFRQSFKPSTAKSSPLKLISTTPPTPKVIPPRTISQRKFGIFGFLFPDEEVKGQFNNVGYKAEYLRDATKKKKSRWIEIKSKPLSYSGANDLGSEYVDKNLSAKYRLNPITQTKKIKGKKKEIIKIFDKPLPKGTGYFKRNSYKFRESKIRKGKKIATPKTFIEKRAYRLDSKGETGRIRKAKRKSRGYFRL